MMAGARDTTSPNHAPYKISYYAMVDVLFNILLYFRFMFLINFSFPEKGSMKINTIHVITYPNNNGPRRFKP